ncbi:hypothetical protein LSCM1_05522 [Leishmania martiniquensis]|uniref:Uncharacterized protein n=1 Tax=Leishmania martiniquensis TaxID=1580590 RepID=A0A836KN35_9TRYP|nr:hypothetical protein LSCM1_05522 [Leishmania martiniquensis]
MSRLPHFHSDSDFHRDEEGSKSMSQVRARPAIRLDKSLSFISTASVPAGNMSGPASPLLSGDSVQGVCGSSSAVASPKLFHTRDLNVEACGQHSLPSLKASRSRVMSGSRTAHSSSRPCSQHPQPHHRHHYPRLPSSCSPSVSRSCGAHSQVRCGEQSRCLAAEAGGGELDVLESEATVLTRPSDPRPNSSEADGALGVRSQRTESVTVSPAPRRAGALSEDFEGALSMPASAGKDEASKGVGGHYATCSNDRETSSFGPGARGQDDADVAKRTSGATPPPRRALVLSRGYSDVDTDTDACADGAPPPRASTEEVARCASVCTAPADLAVDAPRSSAILAVGDGDEDEDGAVADGLSAAAAAACTNANPLATADASRIESPAVPSVLPVGRLVPRVTTEKGEVVAQRSGALTAHRATAPERESARNPSRSLRSESSGGIESPLPWPVPHWARATGVWQRSSPAHAREDEAAEGVEEVRAAREDAIIAREQQQRQPVAETAMVSKVSNASVQKTNEIAETAASTTQDLIRLSVASCTLTASSALGSALHVTSTIPAQLTAPAALTAAAERASASVTPLSSLTMLNSISGASLTMSTAATSSLWLVSGSTPTPLRRLRDRMREVSATLDAEEEEAEGVQEGSAAAESQTECALQLANETSAAAVATPETDAESRREADERSAPADNSMRTKQSIATAEEAHHLCRTSAPLRSVAHSVARTPLSTHSFSPEPARPQAEGPHPPSPSLAARTAVSTSVQLNSLTANDDAVMPAPAEATAPQLYGTATPPPFGAADTWAGLAETAPLMPSPSSAESARVSEEVKELVRRAQAEVCRTRETLISTLRDHRASFRLSEPSPTPKCISSTTASAHLAQPSVAVPNAQRSLPSVSSTPARSLRLPTVAAMAAEPSVPPSTALPTASESTMRTSGEWRSAATVLRPQLRAAADAILRRLQGYDARDHGVLPMDTVVRVAYFVITRRHMATAAWSLRTAEGGLAATPMRVSMVESGGDATFRSERAQLPSHTAEGRRAALLSGTPLGRQLGSSAAGKSRQCAARLSPTAFETPCQQRFSLNACDAVKRSRGSDSPLSLSRPTGRTRPRVCSVLDADTNDEDKRVAAEHHDASVTCTSPTRTLEHVMLLQQHRAEEELHLQFYFTVLEAFKQVFGERYAWQHLGATNASRHDCATASLTQPAQKRRRTGDSPVRRCDDRRGDADVTRDEAHAGRAQLGVMNELDDVPGPLESRFPRLRQQYALIQREKRDAAATAPSSVEGNTGDPLATPRTTDGSVRSEVAAAATGLALRPPPLDVLVYYHTFIESLRVL